MIFEMSTHVNYVVSEIIFQSTHKGMNVLEKTQRFFGVIQSVCFSSGLIYCEYTLSSHQLLNKCFLFVEGEECVPLCPASFYDANSSFCWQLWLGDCIYFPFFNSPVHIK